MRQRCAICETEYEAVLCPSCPEQRQAAYALLVAENSPILKSWPENGLSNAEHLWELRKSLIEGHLSIAESEWLRLIRGMHSHSPEEKQRLASAYEHYAALLDLLQRGQEAGRMRSRARVIRMGPQHGVQKTERRDATYNFIKEIRDEEGASAERLEQVKRELDARLDSEERRHRLLTVAGFGLAGFVGGSLLGLNALAGGAVGLGLGGGVARKKKGLPQQP